MAPFKATFGAALRSAGRLVDFADDANCAVGLAGTRAGAGPGAAVLPADDDRTVALCTTGLACAFAAGAGAASGFGGVMTCGLACAPAGDFAGTGACARPCFDCGLPATPGCRFLAGCCRALSAALAASAAARTSPGRPSGRRGSRTRSSRPSGKRFARSLVMKRRYPRAPSRAPPATSACGSDPVAAA